MTSDEGERSGDAGAPDAIQAVHKNVPALKKPRHPLTIAGAHSTTRAHAKSIWNDRQIEAQPLQRRPGAALGVYFTPFERASDLRRYLRKTAREVETEHGISPGYGDAVVLFSVHATDHLLKEPSPMKDGGREAIIGAHVQLDPNVRLAMVAFDRTRPKYTANDPDATALSITEATKLLC